MLSLIITIKRRLISIELVDWRVRIEGWKLIIYSVKYVTYLFYSGNIHLPALKFPVGLGLSKELYIPRHQGV